MPGLLRAYHQTMPNVKVKLHDWPVEKNLAGVRDGRLQLAIIVPPLKANALAELRFQELTTMRICLAVSCDHPFARRQSVSLADAAREPFIGLMREEYPRYQEYLAAIFARFVSLNCAAIPQSLITSEHSGAFSRDQQIPTYRNQRTAAAVLQKGDAGQNEDHGKVAERNCTPE
jgi:DNA-binding transcriptional LysR family regulator